MENKLLKIWNFTIISLGIIGMILASMGLLVTAIPLAVFAFSRTNDASTGFYVAFYIMSFLTVLCNLGIGYTCFRFSQRKIQYVWLFLVILAFELIYDYVIGMLWISGTEVGKNVAAATGVGLGGLFPQLYIRFPYWAALIAIMLKISERKIG
jgi:hypothetical protein